FSFPVPDLLQWVDSSRKTGTLQVSWDAGERKLFVLSGQVLATSAKGLHERIARMLSLSELAQGELVLAGFREMLASSDTAEPFKKRGIDPLLPRFLANEELHGIVADLTMAQQGRFHWTEDSDRSDEEWVQVDVSVRELVFEALRWVDEQSEVDRALPNESMTVKALARPTADLPLIQRVILRMCRDGITLGRLRLAMGLSRSAANRRVYDLLRAARVSVEGAPTLERDPISDMLEKGAVLVRERQFDAAGMVFASLLASDPADRRVQEFARMVEHEHTASLYGEMPPIDVPQLTATSAELSHLRPEERYVSSLVNGTWDVATIVLASQARELETLKALAKLRRMGALTLPDRGM
ncbi:MAG: DUF4388 domain-containing protein, partial [Myxococcaceae bacterium]